MRSYVNNLSDLLGIANKLRKYLIDKGVEFDKEGFPIFKKEYFLEEYPDLIVPINHRNSKYVTNKKKTLICFYCADKFIYRRLANLFNEIDIYREYMGFVSFDITVTDDMDYEWQEVIMYINQLATAVLCVNGIKCVLNTRIGSGRTIEILSRFPRNTMYASGFLGCSKSSIYDDTYVDKILMLLPSKLIIYGKDDLIINDKLDLFGINYRYYKDFHTMNKEVIK